ncbi:MAG: DUF106 domain-containing protein [Theionarchaea archaeon]|nr:DUF106 domain-containing protein [Theionarchaea archaeon]
MILGFWDTLGELAGYFYGFLDSALGPIWEWPGIYAVFVVAIIVGIISVSAQYFLVDQEKLRTIRSETSEFQKKMIQAQKSGSKKELRKLEAQKKRSQQQQSEMMGMTMRPMFLTFIPIIIFFGWVRAQPAAGELVIDLPFTLPIFGDTLGWLGWYILCSFFFTQVLRKILNMA